MTMRLKERIGEEKAYEVVQALVIPVGLAVQHANFRCVEARRTFENLITYMQRTNWEGPTCWNRVEILSRASTSMRYVFTNACSTKCILSVISLAVGVLVAVIIVFSKG
jgi:hypothetical protein